MSAKKKKILKTVRSPNLPRMPTIEITNTCSCGNETTVVADTSEIALATFRQNGWVASTEDIRTFYTEGQIPIMSCSMECWIASELHFAVSRPIRRAISLEMRQQFDSMMDHVPWAGQIYPVKLLVKAIQAARPGSKEKRLQKRRNVSR